MKTCCRCKEDKTLDEFHSRAANKDGKQGYCKSCAKVHYKKWQDQSPERKYRHSEWKKERLASTRQLYVDYMKDKSCTDCSESDIIVLQHDHVKGVKVDGVLSLLNRGNSWDVILIEIEKCEIRCANCHVRKTAERGAWWVTALYPSG